jgi:hypothetical protein
MPEVPTPREFARLLRRMEVPERARLSDLARKGKLGKDPAEAALVAAAARRAQRGWWWVQLLLILIFGLNLVRVLSTNDGFDEWLGAGSLTIIVASIPWTIVRSIRLMQAERLNRKFAEERP